MDTARWERIQALFHQAADLPHSGQRAFLEGECGDDSGLVDEVLNLLAEDARGASLLDRDVAHIAQEIFGDRGTQALPTEQFGPYQIKAVLGEGGMGVVYLGERQDLGSLAAIKILRDAWLSPARRERFASEQRTLAQLNHPSIARLYDADTLADGTPWFVMEYVEGVPLTRYCDAHAHSIADRLRLFRDVCEAVQHAHRHLVIHRDLKPSNIFVSRDGSVKLLDFGISKQLDSLDVSADQTVTGLRLMTPAYAAPEQLRGSRVGIHTDIYSLGVVLYELLAGRLPFDLSNRTPGEAETVILSQEPEKPSAVARAMSSVSADGAHGRSASRTSWADLDVLILTAMHKDPQRRYRTVEALIRDIDHYLGGEPLEARPDSRRYRADKFVRRNWKPVSAAAVMLATVVGLVVFYTMRLATARNVAVAEAARTQRIQSFMMNLFQGGDEAVGPADTLRVVTLVDRGVREARSLSTDPAVQAELFVTLGTIYQQLGKFARSDSLLRTSLERRRASDGPNHREVSAGLVALALLRDAQAEYDEGERLVREALEKSRSSNPPDPTGVASATAALGRILEDRGAYAAAIPVLEQAARLYSSTVPSPREEAATLTELANTHFYAGHYAISDSLNKRVLVMDRQLHGDRHPHVADDLINLGAIQFEGGHFAEAERYYRQALDIIRPWYGNSHAETASALTMLGRAIVSQGRFDDAAGMLREALTINEQVYGAVHPRVASTLNELGRIAQQQGRLDEAEADFTRMADIYKKVYDNKHYLIGVALANLAGVYAERKQWAIAERTFHEVLQRYADVLSPDHQLIGIAHARLGRVFLRAGRYADAERESLAGLNLLMKQSAPPVTWVRYARTDLVAVYDSLRQPEKAARYRVALADTTSAARPAGTRD